MIDFNSKSALSDRINWYIDIALGISANASTDICTDTALGISPDINISTGISMDISIAKKAKTESPRKYLDCSVLGVSCARGDGLSPIALPALWECKCLATKYWRQAVKEKVKNSHSKYLAQMQLYMCGHNKLCWA